MVNNGEIGPSFSGLLATHGWGVDNSEHPTVRKTRKQGTERRSRHFYRSCVFCGWPLLLSKTCSRSMRPFSFLTGEAWPVVKNSLPGTTCLGHCTCQLVTCSAGQTRVVPSSEGRKKGALGDRCGNRDRYLDLL